MQCENTSIGIEYPLLLYKGTAPDNRELVIVNLADKSQPQKLMHLRYLQFLCFVGTDSSHCGHSVFFIAFDDDELNLCAVQNEKIYLKRKPNDLNDYTVL